jgi:endoglucanase
MTPAPLAQASLPAAEGIPAKMRRGVNLGNALEAPNEGEWGMVIQEEYFDLIREAGFDFVRLPVRWSAHVEEAEPYTISPAFFARVDQVVGWALERGLVVVLNVHHYAPQTSELTANPGRLLSIWRQIALHYQDAPPELVFELFNEPDNTISALEWNEIAAQTLAVVRESNPTREVVIGGVSWNSFDRLSLLRLPADDPHLIATFHYYLPFEFTHQGAEWVEGSNAWLGQTWQGTPAQQRQIKNHFERVARWAEANHLPVLLGEFGAYSKADLDSRALWTAYVREQAEQYGFSWAYWEFGAGFGVYDRAARRWNQPLKEALLAE